MNDVTIRQLDRDAPVLSPFLPGTSIQFAWDSTSLGLLKTCPRLYQYTMIDGWGAKDESVHLRFGGEYHSALEGYDRLIAEGEDRASALRETVRQLLIRTKGWEVDEDTKAGKYKNRRSLLRMVVDYLDKYERDPCETFILDSGDPAVELSFRFELDWGPKAAEDKAANEEAEAEAVGCLDKVNIQIQPYLLSGHLDRVVSLQDEFFVMDRKTTTTTPGDYFFAQFEPNNQMTLYTLASNVILKSPIKGVIIDAAQILVDSSRFVRGFTYRTQDQLEEWVADLRLWFSMAEGYAENNYWPMNDTACDKFGGCKYREICSKSPQVRERFLAAKFHKLAPEDRWNPLRSR